MLDSVSRGSTRDVLFDRTDDTAAGGGADRPSTPRPLPQAPATQAHEAFYASLRTNQVGSKLDALRSAYAGPYQVEGQTVSAPAMFRMNGGCSDANAKVHGKEVEKIAQRAGVSAYTALNGIATPAQLVKVTQALIDAGKLPPGPGDLAARVKTMQWHYGIGIDCACYTRMALLAATGQSETKLGLAPLGTEAFRHLDRNPHFTKVTPERAQPGDIMTLDDPDGDAGHNVIVRSRTTVDDGAKKALTAKWGAAASRFLSGPGPFHAIEVDSSWGAGENGDLTGGARRDTWIYDEGSKTWGSALMHLSPPQFTVGSGPAAESFHGTYRAKEG